MSRTSGRRNKFVRTTNPAAIPLAVSCPAPAKVPTIAEQCRGSVEAGHVDALAQDDAGAEKADARDDLRGDPCRTIVARDHHREHDKPGRAGSDEGVCPQSGHPLAPLPLEADEAAKKHRHSQT